MVTNEDNQITPPNPMEEMMQKFMGQMLETVEKMVDQKLSQNPVQGQVIEPPTKIDDSVESISIDRMKDIKSNLLYFITKKTYSKGKGNRVMYDQHSIPITMQRPNKSTFFNSSVEARKYIEENADPKDKVYLKVQSKTVLSD